VVPLLSLLIGFTLTSWKDEILATLLTGVWQDHTRFNGHATTFWISILALTAVVDGEHLDGTRIRYGLNRRSTPSSCGGETSTDVSVATRYVRPPQFTISAPT
jgi:hypothetical protein